MDHDLAHEGFSGVVLAAGSSLRMGRNKLLMDVAGRPMIRHVVETVRSVVGDVVVVIGPAGELIREALARLPVRYVEADGPAQGASIRAGLAACGIDRPRLVCIGDQPRLTEREIAALLDAYESADDGRVLVPVYEERRGFPIVVPSALDAAAVDLAADDLLQAHADLARAFATRNPVYVSGVDTAEDYNALFRLG